MRIILAATALLIAGILGTTIAAAEEPGYKGSYLGLGVGYFDISQNDGNNALSFELNYQYEDIYHGLRPMGGVMVTSDSALYGFVGAKWDLPLGIYPFVIAPSFAVGGYSQGADGKELGHGIEFRSGLEVAYEFADSGDRLAVQLSHLSNMSLNDKNPGTEILQLNYSLPVDF
jgi:hypothetical protein